MYHHKRIRNHAIYGKGNNHDYSTLTVPGDGAAETATTLALLLDQRGHFLLQRLIVIAFFVQLRPLIERNTARTQHIAHARDEQRYAGVKNSK